MPEGDTVWRAARRLDEALADETILSADLRWPGLSTADLRGMRTLEVVSRGKNLLHRLDAGLTLHSHLRMEGQWRVETTEGLAYRTLANPQLRAVVSTARWTALGVRLGGLHLLATRDEVRLVGHLGPDVLGTDWDAAEAAGRLTASMSTIGSALLDQRNLAGVGTLYASEALFLERLNPWHPAASLASAQVRQVVDRVYRLLNVNQHNVIQSTTGVQRRGMTTYVHGRSGRPCRRCGKAIRVSVLGVPPQDPPSSTAPPVKAASLQGTRDAFRGRSARPPGHPAGGVAAEATSVGILQTLSLPFLSTVRALLKYRRRP